MPIAEQLDVVVQREVLWDEGHAGVDVYGLLERGRDHPPDRKSAINSASPITE